MPFTRELYIDADDFREEANKKYKRLVLGKRVRLRNAYVIEADQCGERCRGQDCPGARPDDPRHASALILPTA